MKVTKLASQKKDPSRVNMYIDENFFCGLSLDSVAKYAIYVGKEITDDELEELLNDELRARFLNRAVSYISRAIKTEFQVRKYLKELSFKKKGKWYEDISKEMYQEIEEHVIGKMKEYGYIDDSNFAELFVTSRIRNKPRGKNVLVSELISKGVSKDIALDTVEGLVNDEMDMLKQIYAKKYGDEELKYDDRKKIDFLLRKGFNWELIQKLMKDES